MERKELEDPSGLGSPFNTKGITKPGPDDSKVKFSHNLNFLVGISDMLAKTTRFPACRELIRLESHYPSIKKVLEVEIWKKLPVILYGWVDRLISHIKTMLPLLHEFSGAFWLSTERNQILIELVKREVPEFEKEIFPSLYRADVLDQLLEWLVADSCYSKDITDHRFSKNAVQLITESINMDTLFNWYRVGVRESYEPKERTQESLKTENSASNKRSSPKELTTVSQWAVRLIENLNSAYTGLRLDGKGGVFVLGGETDMDPYLEMQDNTNKENHFFVIDEKSVQNDSIDLDIFRFEKESLKWILYYRWVIRLQLILQDDLFARKLEEAHVSPEVLSPRVIRIQTRVKEHSGYRRDKSSSMISPLDLMKSRNRSVLLAIDFFRLHSRHIDELITEFATSDNELVEVLQSSYEAVKDVCADLDSYISGS